MKVKQAKKSRAVTITLDSYSAVMMLEAYALRLEEAAERTVQAKQQRSQRHIPAFFVWIEAFKAEAEEARQIARHIEQGDYYLC